MFNTKAASHYLTIKFGSPSTANAKLTRNALQMWRDLGSVPNCFLRSHWVTRFWERLISFVTQELIDKNFHFRGELRLTELSEGYTCSGQCRGEVCSASLCLHKHLHFWAVSTHTNARASGHKTIQCIRICMTVMSNLSSSHTVHALHRLACNLDQNWSKLNFFEVVLTNSCSFPQINPVYIKSTTTKSLTVKLPLTGDRVSHTR